MKKAITILLFFSCCFLYADDYKWDLVNALIRNDYPVVENLINQNINRVSAAEKNLIMNFALTYSHGNNTLQVLNLLQRHNVRPTAFDLFTAINMNQPDAVVQYVINSGAAANGEILLLSMERQRFDIARQFIQAGVDVNYQYPSTSRYADGMTALIYASRYNNLDLVRLLVDRGANINARNINGNTALSIAQANGNEQISDFLIERGASQTAANPVSPQQSGGIGNFLNTQIAEFNPGNYRLSGGNRDLTFTGTANYGNIAFIRNNRVYSGTYQANNGNLTVILDGQAFSYKIDSNLSFSGHGEVWVRTNN